MNIFGGRKLSILRSKDLKVTETTNKVRPIKWLRTHSVLTALLLIFATFQIITPAQAAAQIDYHTISTGSRGVNVKAAQLLLMHKEYDVGTPDGAYGPKTEQAIKDFQRSIGVSPDGHVGPSTWRKLVADIQPKSTGKHVEALTLLLDKYDKKGTADTYGPITTGRVKDFQKNYNILVDGVVGPNTWKRLVFQYTQPEPTATSLCKGLSGLYDTANYEKEGWGTPAAVAHLEKAGEKMHSRFGTRVAFRDLSLEKGGSFPVVNGSRQHASHQTGMDVDLRPMSTTDSHCTTPLTFRSTRYSQTRTSALIGELKGSSESLGRDLLKTVFFNDPTLIRRFPEVRAVRNHDDHLHVRFCSTYYKYDSNYDC